jgi:hypothetical protein
MATAKAQEITFADLHVRDVLPFIHRDQPFVSLSTATAV